MLGAVGFCTARTCVHLHTHYAKMADSESAFLTSSMFRRCMFVFRKYND